MKIFVTGTDTDVGKTLLCSWLCLHLQADYWKPIQAGLTPPTDSDTVSALSGATIHAERYRLSRAASPHLAAARDHLTIDCRDLHLPTSQRLIVEGAGGVLVPLNATERMIDLMAQWQLPVLLVARTTLGTINHTCLSLQSLRRAGVPVLGVILNGVPDAEIREAIETYGQVEVLAEFAPMPTMSRAALLARPLPQRFTDRLAALTPASVAPSFPTLLPKSEGDTETLAELDQRYLWHPFTQAHTAAAPIAIARGEGATLYDTDGKAYSDLISSWWVNLHGHGHPSIAQAIAAQAHTLEHVLFAGFTHAPAVHLAQALIAALPAPLARVFFSDNGSTATEIALKMSYQYWYNQGQPQRKLFLAFSGAYHGDTFGAMAAGRESPFFTPFQPFFFDVLTLPYVDTWAGDASVTAREAAALAVLDEHLAQHATHIAALIVEPLVQGASGMRMCRAEFLSAVMARVRAHGILIIFDEVMTGFGRTGKLFACQHLVPPSTPASATTPDVLCLSKGLTGGFLPLAATVVTAPVYDAFLGDPFSRAFAHGHSYTANPLGCAAALASLKLFAEENTLQKIAALEHVHRQALARLSAHPHVRHTRVLGSIAAFDLYHSRPEMATQLARTLQQRCLAAGLIVRPLGAVVYLLPPYCVTPEALQHAYQQLEKILQSCVSDIAGQTMTPQSSGF